jgi:uncharacterized protein (TIRG00374 family)
MLIVMACAILLYGSVLAFADYRSISASLRHLPLTRIALVLSLSTSSYTLRFVRWHRYLRILGIQTKLSDSALIFACGLGMGITPGKAGELIKSVMLQQASSTPIARSVPILLAERLTDGLAIVLLASLGLLPSWFGVGVVTCTLLGCVLLSIVIGSQAAGHWTIAQLSRIPLIGKHRARLTSALESLATLCSPLRLLEGLGISVCAWAMHSVCLLSVARVFESVHLDMLQALFIDGATSLAGALAMLPGGIGLTEASMAGALVAFGHGLVTPAVATAITLAVRLMTLWWAVGLGLLSLGIWQLKHRR